jgi:hypothetical protein
MHAPGLLEHLGCGVRERAERAAAAVVDEDADGSELVLDACMGGRHLLRERGVARDRECRPPGGADLVGKCARNLRAARHQRDAIALGESAGESSSQPGTDSHDDRDPRLFLRHVRAGP